MKYLILLILLTGCYNQRKATVQHGRAVNTYPEIGADYCARTYPQKDSLIKGDSVVLIDTIYEGGDTVFDTVIVKDTVRITKTIQLPAQVITRTVTVRDTIVRENTARFDACEIERKKVVAQFEGLQAERNKYKGQAQTRLYILIGLALAAAVWLYFKLKSKK